MRGKREVLADFPLFEFDRWTPFVVLPSHASLSEETKKDIERREYQIADLCRLLAEASSMKERRSGLIEFSACLQEEISRLNEVSSLLPEDRFALIPLQIRQNRTAVLTSLHRDVEELCALLESPLPTDLMKFENDLSPSRIDSFSSMIEKLQEEKNNREDRINGLVHTILDIWIALDYTAEIASSGVLSLSTLASTQPTLNFSLIDPFRAKCDPVHPRVHGILRGRHLPSRGHAWRVPTREVPPRGTHSRSRVRPQYNE